MHTKFAKDLHVKGRVTSGQPRRRSGLTTRRRVHPTKLRLNET